jgi:hypothetical protein
MSISLTLDETSHVHVYWQGRVKKRRCGILSQNLHIGRGLAGEVLSARPLCDAAGRHFSVKNSYLRRKMDKLPLKLADHELKKY